VATARLGGGAAPARRRRPASGAAWPGRGQGGPAERGCPRDGAGASAQAARGGAKARGDGGSRRRAVAGPFRPWRSKAPAEGAAQRRGVLGDLGALGGDEQAHAGVARGVRRRRNRASAAARRRSGSGGAGFKRGWGWEGRGERGEAHRRLDLSGRRPERGVRRRGRSSAGSVMTAGGWKADSAAERVGRLGKEALEVRGEAKRVGVWGIEKGREEQRRKTAGGRRRRH